jgi:hypothetical protein
MDAKVVTKAASTSETPEPMQGGAAMEKGYAARVPGNRVSTEITRRQRQTYENLDMAAST